MAGCFHLLHPLHGTTKVQQSCMVVDKRAVELGVRLHARLDDAVEPAPRALEVAGPQHRGDHGAVHVLAQPHPGPPGLLHPALHRAPVPAPGRRLDEGPEGAQARLEARVQELPVPVLGPGGVLDLCGPVDERVEGDPAGRAPVALGKLEELLGTREVAHLSGRVYDGVVGDEVWLHAREPASMEPLLREVRFVLPRGGLHERVDVQHVGLHPRFQAPLVPLLRSGVVQPLGRRVHQQVDADQGQIEPMALAAPEPLLRGRQVALLRCRVHDGREHHVADLHAGGLRLLDDPLGGLEVPVHGGRVDAEQGGPLRVDVDPVLLCALEPPGHRPLVARVGRGLHDGAVERLLGREAGRHGLLEPALGGREVALRRGRVDEALVVGHLGVHFDLQHLLQPLLRTLQIPGPRSCVDDLAVFHRAQLGARLLLLLQPPVNGLHVAGHGGRLQEGAGV
mmetsp:Transcript_1007/g.3062  ORF Transcript_1007/g.3062 Transcript_1007/m.3062 type:complete len:452 (-) Transcript_1007:520-1875(-)